jgi:hypothetical protein
MHAATRRDIAGAIHHHARAMLLDIGRDVLQLTRQRLVVFCDALHQIFDTRQFFCTVFRHGSSFAALLHCRTASTKALCTALTLPIIGRRPVKWNIFSIFLCHEIFIATRLKMA